MACVVGLTATSRGSTHLGTLPRSPQPEMRARAEIVREAPSGGRISARIASDSGTCGMRGPNSRQSTAQCLDNFELCPVGVANLTEFLPRQRLKPGHLDLGELVDRDDVLDGFELIRLNLLPPRRFPRPV